MVALVNGDRIRTEAVIPKHSKVQMCQSLKYILPSCVEIAGVILFVV